MSETQLRLPKIALVGRPNVGKSALFNRICDHTIAIVDEAEGITRDRLYADAECFGQHIRVIDTGGIDPHSELPFHDEVRRQTEIAIEEADSLIMVVDAQVGVTALDEFVANLLLKRQKPVCLAVNKIDSLEHLDKIHEFYSLGISDVVAISATHGFQIAEVLEKALEKIEQVEIEERKVAMKLAIIGRPNVGKSTLLNFLLQEDRCIVSPIAGTTRDSIDVDFSRDGKDYTLIDTAGIRRKKSEHEVVDKFAAIRTERAIARSDVCLIILDAEIGLTAQDKHILQMVEEAGKGCVLLFNKWDKVHGCRMEHCLKSLHFDNHFVAHCPTIFMSAINGRNVQKIFPLAEQVYAENNRRITTGQLNRFIEKAQQKYHPPVIQCRRLRIFYLTQVSATPPHFVLFVNDTELMSQSYKKYLVNQLREAYGFGGVPFRFTLKMRQQKDKSNTPPKPKEDDESFEAVAEEDFSADEAHIE